RLRGERGGGAEPGGAAWLRPCHGSVCPPSAAGGAGASPPPARPAGAEEFAVVYRFPGIKYCRALSRLKLLQTATTLAVVPPVCYLYLQGQASQTVLLYTTGVAFFAGVMLYGMSYFFRRIIGFIYLSESGRTVKVAHLTFWGKRNDIYCPIETVMTSDEAGDVQGELLLQFKRYNSKDTLYFTTKYGQVVDRQNEQNSAAQGCVVLDELMVQS
uniref:Transmembrane protein 186 n=1 Tax=Anas platyrhynchos TaxID=8839 RepID=A0A8B9SKH9_ANAPL